MKLTRSGEGVKTNVMICRSIETRTGSSNVIGARRHKHMGSVSLSGYSKAPRIGSRGSVHGTCIGKLRRDGGSRFMVRIVRAGSLAFGELSPSLRGRSDAVHAGHKWKCHSTRYCHDG